MANERTRGRTNLLIGMLLVGFGAMFLFGQLFNINMWRFFWPFFIIIPGVLFFLGMALGGKSAGPLAIPGSIVTMVGLLLLYQSITNHWASWAYAWALIFPTAVGVGLVINGSWSEMDSLVSIGVKWIMTGLGIFAAGGIVMELLFNVSGNNPVGNFLWPAVLIGGGLYLLNRRKDNAGDLNTPAVAPEHSEEAIPEIVFEPIDTDR